MAGSVQAALKSIEADCQPGNFSTLLKTAQKMFLAGEFLGAAVPDSVIQKFDQLFMMFHNCVWESAMRGTLDELGQTAESEVKALATVLRTRQNRVDYLWFIGRATHPLLGGDPAGMKLDQTSEPPDRLGGAGCQTLSNPGNPTHYIKTQCLAFPVPGNRWGNLGRNTIIGPGQSKLDFSVFKNNDWRRVSESFNAQFRAEFFNILNRSNFSSPTDNRTVFDQNGNPIPNAGLITSTQTTSRQIQFALKLIW